MTLVTLYLLIIILNVDGSIFLIKKHRVTGQIEKKKRQTRPNYMLPTLRVTLTLWNIYAKSEWTEKILRASRNQMRARIAIFISEKNRL